MAARGYSLISLVTGLCVARIYFHYCFWQLLVVLILAPLIYWLLISLDQQRRQQRLRQLLRQSLSILAFYLRIGKSLSEATVLTANELQRMGSNIEEFTVAWQDCKLQISLNQAIGKVYQRLAVKLDLEPAHILAGILETGLKTGANLIRIVEETGLRLQAQLDYEEALAAHLAARRLEGCILLVAPLVLILLLSSTLQEYMSPLYQGKGSLVMLIVLLMQTGGGCWFLTIINRAQKTNYDLEAAGFMDCLALLLQAGLTLPAAWQQAVKLLKKIKNAQKGPFFQSIQRVNRDLLFNGSLATALSIMEQNCNDTAASLAVLLQQNLRKGGNQLAYMLFQEANQVRKRQAHLLQVNKGRQEIWLLFPLVLMLLSSLLLTVAPAVLNMGS